MADYNLVVIVGRLSRDPEMKYTAGGGVPYARMSIAVNRQYTAPDGTLHKSVVFVDVSVWRNQAEIACQFLKKGSTCLVSGFLEQSRWVDADQKKHSRLRVRAERLQFMDRKPADGEIAQPVAAGVPEESANGDSREPDAEE